MDRRIVCSILGLVVLAGLPVIAQEGETQMPPEVQERFAKMAAPSEHHEHLQMLVGDWTYDAKFWMPGAPEMKTSGTMNATALLDGRFVRANWHGEMMGMQFEGIGVDGYDTIKGEYTSTWMDNSGSLTYRYTGKCENDGKVRMSLGTVYDPMTGGMVKDEGKVTFNDDGTVLLESWRVTSDGKKTKAMEIVLTRS